MPIIILSPRRRGNWLLWHTTWSYSVLPIAEGNKFRQHYDGIRNILKAVWYPIKCVPVWFHVSKIYALIVSIIVVSQIWWRHQMETFSVLLAICAGNSPVPSEFHAHRPVTRSFDVFFDLRLNKRLSKQSWSWWFETLSRPLWRHWDMDND